MSDASCEDKENTLLPPSFPSSNNTSSQTAGDRNQSCDCPVTSEQSHEKPSAKSKVMLTPCWKLTVKEALDLQVPDAEAEHRQLVQPGPHLLGEGQQAGELVQLPVEPVSVAFGGVGLGSIGRRRFGAVGTKTISIYGNTEESKHRGKLAHLVLAPLPLAASEYKAGR